MKTEKPVVEAAAYEPPCMTVVPIRTSGTLLTGSTVGRMNGFEDQETHNFGFQNESDNVVTEWGNAPTSDWGENFF